MLNEDTYKFLKVFSHEGYDGLAIRSFSDKSLGLKGLSKNGTKIRCNICGKYYSEHEVYLGIKNRPICKKCAPVKLGVTLDEIDNKYINILNYKNKYCNQGIHLAINGGHTDKEVTKVNAHFFEIDDKPFEEQEEIIRNLSIKPSMIVKTRKSYHVYFLIKNGNPKIFKNIQQRMAYTFGGDMQKSNLSTCMRIPGFYHNKKEPIMVKLVKYNPELVYTQSEIIHGLKLLRLPEKPKTKRNSLIFQDKDELINMFIFHTREYIYVDKGDRILMSCISPSHKDNNPSAVFFKESLFYHCSGCGYNISLEQLAKEMNWHDIIHYIENKKNIS